MELAGHLYKGIAVKVPWFIKRFGANELWKKPLRKLASPFVTLFAWPKSMVFEGEYLEYVYSSYNTTWANERCLEIALAKHVMKRFSGQDVLEVGNVMQHYVNIPMWHRVIDKYEEYYNVINKDICEYQTDKRYDLVLSVSTLEHVGFDDEGSMTFQGALKACMDLVRPGGSLVFTVPIGYNPAVDWALKQNCPTATKVTFFKRMSYWTWEEVYKEEAMLCRYKSPFPYANAIALVEIKKPLST